MWNRSALFGNSVPIASEYERVKIIPFTFGDRAELKWNNITQIVKAPNRVGRSEYWRCSFASTRGMAEGIE